MYKLELKLYEVVVRDGYAVVDKYLVTLDGCIVCRFSSLPFVGEWIDQIKNGGKSAQGSMPSIGSFLLEKENTVEGVELLGTFDSSKELLKFIEMVLLVN